jgi:hypothetical protein
MEDGAARAVPAVTVALLRMLGVAEAASGALDQIADLPVYGGGQVVGQIVASLPDGC